MGWRSTARSFGIPTTTRGVLRSLASSPSYSSSWEREERRRQRELERRKKELDKMEELERARFAVDEYENYVSVIRSVHKECGEAWDWLHARDTPPPAEPRLGNGCEAEAQKAYDGYVPSTFDKIFHRIKKRTARLLRSVEEARRKDQEDYKKACEAHSQEMKEWKKINAIATRICARDLEGYIEAIKELKPLSEIEHLGLSVNISIEKKEIAECTLHVHDETVIPKDVKTLLKSGRLSVKSMPVMKFYELYQDYVCGAALRVAREMLALLPVEKVMINALSNMLNPATGYVEETPILSALVPRETLEGLNFDTLDPSDSMKNFVHRMSFKKGKGFERIEAIKL
jgi:hypothetical protein